MRWLVATLLTAVLSGCGGPFIGTSVEGRPIEALTFGAGRPLVLIVGSIHGNEPEGLPAVAALIERWTESPPPARSRVIPDLNPDATANRTRGNARGVDLNRNWPTANFRPSRTHGPAPLSEPESLALARELARHPPDLVIVCHSIRSGPFVNFDGPAGELAARFAAAAGLNDPRWRVVPDMGYGTPGSLGTYLGVERGVPILTVEFSRGHDPDAAARALIAGVGAVLDAHPATVRDPTR
ncbi:MAG: succinylglutamate desuccinylase/aspartoacylase family protein [Phycisphaeraceae bacterium]|nr:MAG: succinylglutamate desuccinylase/aspartoacylase family protein [Phycisphaeraceae bacterium]